MTAAAKSRISEVVVCQSSGDDVLKRGEKMGKKKSKNLFGWKREKMVVHVSSSQDKMNRNAKLVPATREG